MLDELCNPLVKCQNRDDTISLTIQKEKSQSHYLYQIRGYRNPIFYGRRAPTCGKLSQSRQAEIL